ncbi:hypothetical protein G6O69_22480 [Pseudenhygromyxa sp. WMMC2535]|uniref:hypothetical protein n=1 Tax=Pseudenhygromyxa sp. WMMC2535 TaxID=2712867 RepID=UPI001555D468|nr:hypothetical protein [Pseudenhygromyxa sp. WMMC2535]NVB40622.1 hypothetical protein [Pseudenhygromyxa sp. WMMC2535]
MTEALCDELSEKLEALGDLSWEIGPSDDDGLFIAISPDGNSDLLAVTRKIVSRAPHMKGWSPLPAKPPREDMLRFTIEGDDGGEIAIDGSPWMYILYRLKDGKIEILIEQNNLATASDEERYLAAVILLDGLLGEERRLELLDMIDTVPRLPPDLEQKSRSIQNLPDALKMVLHV